MKPATDPVNTVDPRKTAASQCGHFEPNENELGEGGQKLRRDGFCQSAVLVESNPTSTIAASCSRRHRTGHAPTIPEQQLTAPSDD